jgi:predicted LPLAT superfamily acyltransferase
LPLDRIVVLWLSVALFATWLVRDVDGAPWWQVAVGLGAAAIHLGWPRVGGAEPARVTKLAVLVPTHDNAVSVGDVVRRATAHGLPVYVVDDGSTDGSGERARQAGGIVLFHPKNLGKGQALLTGMRAAGRDGYTHAICLDADGQHDPDDIPRFADVIRREPLAIVAGLRDLSTAPGSSRFGRAFSNFWIWFETGWRVADSQCGFRAYPIAAVERLALSGSRYDMEVEVLTRALWSGVPVLDLPCRVYYPPPAERVSSFRPFVDNARISVMNTRLVAERLLWPPRWFLRVRRSTWSGRSRGSRVGWRAVIGVLRVFGRMPAYAVVTALAAWYTLFAGDARRAVTGVIARVRPNGWGPAAAFLVFRNFAIAIVDRLAFFLHGPAAFRYVREGSEHLISAFTEGNGAVLLSSHHGNVEVANGGAGAEDRAARLAVVRFVAAGDPAGVLAELPQTWMPRIIPVQGAEGFSTLSILRQLREGGVIAMHADRTVDDRTVTVDFLGGTMRVPSGPWLLAALADVPILEVECYKEGLHTYRVYASPPTRYRFDRRTPRDAQVQAWAQAWADRLAVRVRRYPYQWYNFHSVWGGSPTP